MVKKHQCMTCGGRIMNASSREDHEAGSQHKRNAKIKMFPAIYAFFDRYSGFSYDEALPPMVIFEQLRAFYGWTEGCRGKGYRKARTELCQIILKTFKDWMYPTDDLDRFKVLSSIHVNLIDVLLALASGQPIRYFSSAGEMRRYTRETAKYFNRTLLESGCPLRALLKMI
ncbi:hypothetical protein KEM56_004758 [Ascosphaera pollenicola]|nr:hypothetical protein KEM56_004758 [Ascosphaera pollenicola]